MRSLFLRIFLSFSAATVVIGAVLVVLALTSDPRRGVFRAHEKRLVGLGRELVAAYQEGGAEALRELDRSAEGRHGRPAFLFRGIEGPLSGLPAPRPVRHLAAQAAATGERQAMHGRWGLLLAVPLGGEYVLVVEAKPPSRIERLFDPYGLTLRLGMAFLVIVLVSYLLARSLSAPLRQLREAARGLASGDLSVRAGPAVARRRDETGELGRDFNRMAERIQSMLEAQKRLLRDISHELRSPLARLHVALGLARQDSGAEAVPALDRIEREADRLNDLIGQLLTLAILESGGEAGEREPLDLGGLVREVVEDADFEAKGRGRGVRATGVGEAWVEGAPELLRRAIENVVRNAVRFTAEGTTVEVRIDRPEEAKARVVVRDRGPGVPARALGSLFEPFYRVADARDRQSGGTGIGLAITERAVRLHGGAVRAANIPEGGLEVVIELPVRGEEGA